MRWYQVLRPLGGDGAMRVEPHKWDLCPYQRHPCRAPFPLSHMGGHRRSLPSKPANGLSPEPNCTWHPVSAIQPPQVWEINFLRLWASLWCFVIAARAGQHRHKGSCIYCILMTSIIGVFKGPPFVSRLKLKQLSSSPVVDTIKPTTLMFPWIVLLGSLLL